MKQPSDLFTRLAILFPYGFALLTFSILFAPQAMAESKPPQSIEPSSKREPNRTSLPYACWKLSYQLGNTTYQRQLTLEGDRGTLQSVTTTAKSSETQPVSVNDVDTDGWLRRQLFLWKNRIKQRATAEQELERVKQQIASGRLKGTQLEDVKQFQQSLQTLLSSSNPQGVVQNLMKAEAIQVFQKTQQRINVEAQQAEKQLDAQIEQRRQQILTALKDPKSVKQLNEQLRQIEDALKSNKIQAEQRTQLERARDELKAIQANPNSVNQRAKEFRDERLSEIRGQKQTVLGQAQGELSKHMLSIDNDDNVLVVMTSGAMSSDVTRNSAFSLQLRNGNYVSKTCNAKGDCVPVTVEGC